MSLINSKFDMLIDYPYNISKKNNVYYEKRFCVKEV